MTHAAKIIYTLALVIGLSAGSILSFMIEEERLKSYYSSRRSVAPIALDEFSFMQYRHADTEHAKSALQAFANLLEKLEALHPEKGHQRQLANTYTRLSSLEDRENNPQLSSSYMEKAQAWYTAAGIANLPDSEIKVKVKEMDERLDTAR